MTADLLLTCSICYKNFKDIKSYLEQSVRNLDLLDLMMNNSVKVEHANDD